MVNLENNFNNMEPKILLQVHDELLFEVEKNQIGECIKKIRPIMENANLPMKPLKVKLKVDYGYGRNWAEAH